MLAQIVVIHAQTAARIAEERRLFDLACAVHTSEEHEAIGALLAGIPAESSTEPEPEPAKKRGRPRKVDAATTTEQEPVDTRQQAPEPEPGPTIDEMRAALNAWENEVGTEKAMTFRGELFPRLTVAATVARMAEADIVRYYAAMKVDIPF